MLLNNLDQNPVYDRQHKSENDCPPKVCYSKAIDQMIDQENEHRVKNEAKETKSDNRNRQCEKC